ncbi:MAG: hypothetical protein QF473_21185 [Planctomycetota bacterium]|nr:hypothetical protein [Planctomycetota bacterium]
MKDSKQMGHRIGYQLQRRGEARAFGSWIRLVFHPFATKGESSSLAQVAWES